MSVFVNMAGEIVERRYDGNRTSLPSEGASSEAGGGVTIGAGMETDENDAGLGTNQFDRTRAVSGKGPRRVVYLR